MNGLRSLLGLYRQYGDDGDAWGAVMGWWFAICDILVDYGPPYPPAQWEFHQSPFGSDREQYEYIELAAILDSGEATAADVLELGNVLARYASLLKVAGRDY